MISYALDLIQDTVPVYRINLKIAQDKTPGKVNGRRVGRYDFSK